MNEYPLVSIIAVCYNHADYVEETLNSIKNQNYPNIQLIVIDDCSSDESVKTIENWKVNNESFQFEFVAHQVNQGLCKTLNEALDLVKGKYYKGFSCDDVLKPEFVNSVVHVFESSDENLGFVFSDMETIDENGKLLESSFLLDRIKLKTLPSQVTFDAVYKSNIIPAPAVMIKTEIIDEIGKYDEGFSFEDLDFYLRALKNFECALDPSTFVQYRILSTSHVRSRSIMFEKDLISIYEKHSKHSPFSRETYGQRLKWFAIERYKDGFESKKWLRKSLKYSFSLRILVYLVLNFFRKQNSQ